MADGIDRAAQAFDAVVNMDANKSVRPARPKGPESGGTNDTLFRSLDRNVEVDADSPEIGGGDAEDDRKEEAVKSRARDPRKGEKRDSEDDDADPVEYDSDDDDPAEGEGSEGGDDEAAAASGDDGSEEEGSEEDKAILGKKIEVTIDGEPAEVTVKEALEGYVRTETFHRRMNQLDEAKKIVRRAATDAVQNFEYAQNLAKQMEAHMAEMIPKEPDWDAEFQKDPAKAREMQRYYEKANAFRSSLDAQMKEASNKLVESNHAQLRAFAEEEGQKFESMNRKNWTDPNKKAKDLSSMRKTALATGFTEEELSQVYDSRMLTVLLKASKYDRMMAAKPKPVVRMPQGKPIPPGAGSAKQRTAQKGVSQAMKRLNRTGSIEDAAVVFDQIIAKG